MHLDELDKKLWTVLSCPVKGLHFDKKTLEYLDSDNDGTIKVDEVVAAAKWLSVVLKDPDLLLEGSDDLMVSNIDSSTDDGIAILEAAKRLKKDMGDSNAKISKRESEEFSQIFLASPFNGDGVIIVDSCTDPLDKKAVEACLATVGGVADVSGAQGVGVEQVEAFYAALQDWTQWCEKGDASADAMAKVEAVADKINDYFLRCKLIAFDQAAQTAVDFSADSLVTTAAAGLLSKGTAEIVSAPLAKPQKEAVLPYDAINPAWQDAFTAARKAVFDKEFPKAKGITLEQWEQIEAALAAYKAWNESKKGEQVAALGYETAKQLLAENRKESLLALIAQDKALENQLQSLKDLDKLIHYNQYFYAFLKNYVIFNDFYSNDKSVRAIFEEGKLYIDQRCCELCVRVEDMATHGDMAALSGMYLVYCTCTRKDQAPINIVAALTVGDVKNLRVGTNAVFYDRDGNDWNAVVTKLVDNPISLSQAFWSPYRKFANFIGEKIRKSASEKDAKAMDSLKAAADNAAANPDKSAAAAPPFDIAKFAGIFAAIGMAIGYIGAFLTTVVDGIKGSTILQIIGIVVGIMVVISGPSCLLAGIKLHRRNLGPVLNANGWAINSDVIVNIVFGSTLTSIASYPRITVDDPFAEKKTPWWQKALIVLGILAVIAIWMYFSGTFEAIAGMFNSSVNAQ